MDSLARKPEYWAEPAAELPHPRTDEDAPLYTYADYITWPDDMRCELINGRVYMMSAPMVNHQRIIGELFVILHDFLKDKPCEAFMAPCDVRLDKVDDEKDEKHEKKKPKDDRKDRTVVQPDVMVVCDPHKVHDEGIHGAPDFAIEVLSESSRSHDMVRKLNKYREAGVREYWIVDGAKKKLYKNVLKSVDGESVYESTQHGAEPVVVDTLAGFLIDMAEVFV